MARPDREANTHGISSSEECIRGGEVPQPQSDEAGPAEERPCFEAQISRSYEGAQRAHDDIESVPVSRDLRNVNQIGCFEVEQLAESKWRVKNTLNNNCVHVTYGTEAEVTEQLRKQTEIWEQKHYDRINKVKKRGSAWRATISGETRKAAASNGKR